MKAFITITTAALAIALGLGATTASAHNGAPWLHKQYVEDELLDYGIPWEEGTVLDASCRGTGLKFQGRFRHFVCYVEVDSDEPYYVLAHTRWDLNTYDFLRYA
jgi:hypothetical protein